MANRMKFFNFNSVKRLASIKYEARANAVILREVKAKF